MLTNDGEWPIPFDETWNITDASKLKTFAQCPRMYFYEYVLGWRLDGLNIHLAFGSAWHKAMEYILLNGSETPTGVEEILRAQIENGLTAGEAALEVLPLYTNINGAYQAFLDEFRKEIPEDMEEMYSPKTSDRAALALLNYCLHRHDLYDYELAEISGKKAVEIAGSLMIQDILLTFRIDALLRSKETGKIRVLEHKTGSAGFNWAEQWELDIQMGLYNYVLGCMYPPEEKDCVWVNGNLFKKTKYVKSSDKKDPFRHFELIRQPVYKTNEQIMVWWANTLSKIVSIETEFSCLRKESEDNIVMTSFPMREINCHAFYGRACAYKDFCVSWPNPLRRCEEPPPGFVVEYWDPMLEEANINLEIREET